MEFTTSIWILIGACVLVLLLGALRAKMEWIINFVLRMASGALAIYLINFFLLNREIDAVIGLGFASLLTCGILGFPGLILLYGINFYNFL
ncbi:MAG: pro-sigmaK processing inhibitor BofA family protein [Lachnospiraceae bacterium]|nr:pro-sigmaK processing inhibitor BofA family protein [Lachnospiraceae bacterium]